MKERLVLYGVILVLGFALVIFALSKGVEQYPVALRIDGNAFKVKVADSDKEREKGLSGTEKLPQKRGMLFIFDTNGFWSIWMKDMNYPLDIIWLSEQKRIVHIEENVEPDTYPQNFMPHVPAKYVVEFPANTVAKNSLKEGDAASFVVPE